MIITQTPLRVGVAGGCTDLPDYYVEHGGRVLSCAIDKYVYVIVKRRFDEGISVNYWKNETVSDVCDLEHELVREAMLMTGAGGGVEITMLSDVPSGGTGLDLFVHYRWVAPRALGVPAEACPGRGIGRAGVHD